MKLPYPHILEGTTAEPKQLRIISIINDVAGERFEASVTQPSDWKNFRHIVGNLYYGWDDDATDGEVYVTSYE
jgi:hypothetical protein